MLRKWLVMLASAGFVLAPWAAAQAWNGAGHRVIAFRQLDDATRTRVVKLLEKHPAADSLWANHQNNGSDPALNLFMNAAIFPDDARDPGPFQRFHRTRAHFVNFRIMASLGNLVLDPLPGENVINSYAAHVSKIEAGRAPADGRALSLSWIFHQAGDIHQPLHAVARFSAAAPEGDQGGNLVGFPNPRGRDNLHSYWDALLGTDESPAGIGGLADALIAEHPKAGFADELRREGIGDWTAESIDLALKKVYRNLDPEVANFADQPVGYEADAIKAARRRAALAGYRLADQLTALFPPEP